MCSYKVFNVKLLRVLWCCAVLVLPLLSSSLEAQKKPLFGRLDQGGMPFGLIELTSMKKSSGWILNANTPYTVWAAPKVKGIQYWASAWRPFGPYTLGSTKRYIFNWDGASHGGRLATNPEVTVTTPILSPAYASLHVQNFDGINVWVIVNPLPPGGQNAVKPTPSKSNYPNATIRPPTAAAMPDISGSWLMVASSDNGNCNGSTVVIRQTSDGRIASVEGTVTCEKGVATGRYVGENIRWLNPNKLEFDCRYTSKSVERLRDGKETMIFTSVTTAKQPNGPGVWKKQ